MMLVCREQDGSSIIKFPRESLLALRLIADHNIDYMHNSGKLSLDEKHLRSVL